MKKFLGIILAIGGIAMIVFSFYIKSQVAEGKAKASSAQSTVDKGTWLFSQNPISKEVGKGLTNPIQKQIDEGESQISYYENMATWLLIGGIGVLIIGGAVVLISRKKTE
jgi:LPXTG-motif cell wall-anchored protein